MQKQSDKDKTSSTQLSAGMEKCTLSSTPTPAAGDDSLSNKSSESSASATGNPRNKVALRPGHSLMDWVRLGNSGQEDLSGTGGKIRDVTAAELAKHRTPTDLWMAIKGRVYNVTRYLDFHPGGEEELLRGAGKDATKLFNEVHAWVNVEQMLAKCLIGPLKGTAVTAKPIRNTLAGRVGLSISRGLPPPASVATTASVALAPPRLDWFQQLASLTLVLYSGLVSRVTGFLPPWCLVRLEQSELSIQVENVRGEPGKRHLTRVSLQQPIAWPPSSLSLHRDSGKVEVVFRKLTQELWPRYGELKSQEEPDCTLQREECPLPASLVCDSELVCRDTKLLRLKFEEQTACTLPVPCHVRVALTQGGVSRPYTVVSPSLALREPSAEPGDITLMVKACGDISRALCTLSQGQKVWLSEPRVSPLDSRRVGGSSQLLLLAAGSGLTPMLRIIPVALEDGRRICSAVHLVLFNRTESDIAWNDQLQKLEKQDTRFSYCHVLSEPSPDWTGVSGRIGQFLLTKLVTTIGSSEVLAAPSEAGDEKPPSQAASGGQTPSIVISGSGIDPKPVALTLGASSTALACVCGPDPFVHESKRLLLALGLRDDQIHCF